ncbi:MAG: hypothetical protein ACREOM_06235 [Candidatus Dormibacteraceae bacterium]
MGKEAAGMVSGWLIKLSIRSAMFAGAIAGFVFGLFAGGLLGALISWFAGAIVDWQAQLGYSLGVTQQLLPLGNQLGSLQSLADGWYYVGPAAALVVGVFGAAMGALAAGLWAALVNIGALPIEVKAYPADDGSRRRRAGDARQESETRRQAMGAGDVARPAPARPPS